MIHKITTCVAILFTCCLFLYPYFDEHATQIISKTSVSNDSEILELPIFRAKPLVMWTIDFHATPAYDLMLYLKPMGVTFIYRITTETITDAQLKITATTALH